MQKASPSLHPTRTTHPLLQACCGRFQERKARTPSGHQVGREAQASGDERHRTSCSPATPPGLPSGALWSHLAPTPPPDRRRQGRSHRPSWAEELVLPAGL